MPTLTAAVPRSPQGKRVARPGSGSAGLQSLCIFCMIEPRRVSSLLSPQSQSIPTAPADSKLRLSENTQRASSCTCCFLDIVLLSSSAYKGLNNKTLLFQLLINPSECELYISPVPNIGGGNGSAELKSKLGAAPGYCSERFGLLILSLPSRSQASLYERKSSLQHSFKILVLKYININNIWS